MCCITALYHIYEGVVIVVLIINDSLIIYREFIFTADRKLIILSCDIADSRDMSLVFTQCVSLQDFIICLPAFPPGIILFNCLFVLCKIIIFVTAKQKCRKQKKENTKSILLI